MKYMKKNKTIGGVFRIAVSVMLALSVLLIAGCKQKETVQTDPPQTNEGTTMTEPTNPPLEILETKEEDTDILVKTSYCVLKYPFAFSDMVKITVMQEDSLLFAAIPGEEEVPAFALRFGVPAGIPVGTLQLPVNGESISVGIDLFTIPDSLAEEHHSSFYAVQEIINDLIASLEENAQFTPAEA